MRVSSHSGRFFLALVFLAVVPLLVHALYSALGFNPAFDGVTLAWSRRLLDGQVPHRDFIILRPALSPLLHLPCLWFPANYQVWFSRLAVWFELAVIAWGWAALADRQLKGLFRLPDLAAIAVMGFVFSAQSFPAVAWHVLDGLLLATLGLTLCVREGNCAKAVGYVLLGSACLCKPSFGVLAPLTLVVLRDWRAWRYWLAAIAPGLLYLGYLAVNGAWHDAVLQMYCWPSLVRGLRLTRFAYGPYTLAGYFAMRWICGSPPLAFPPQRWLQVSVGVLLIFALPLYASLRALMAGGPEDLALSLFWTVAGAGTYFFLDRTREFRPLVRLALWALALTWSATVSPASLLPAVTGGILFSLLVLMVADRVSRPGIRTAFLVLMATVAVYGFGEGRRAAIPEEKPADELTCSLDGLFPGADLIQSNTNTWRFLSDFQDALALARTRPRPYAILPDLPGYWAASSERNPLSVANLREAEQYNTNVLARVIAELDAGRSNVTVICEKTDANRLQYGLYRLHRVGRNMALSHVRQHFKKIGETECFDLYE